MAKESLISKNSKKLALVAKFSEKRDKIIKERKDKKTTPQKRRELDKKLNKLPRNSSKVRVRNICSITGKPRGYYRFFGMCRNKIREHASIGELSGLRKSSW